MLDSVSTDTWCEYTFSFHFHFYENTEKCETRKPITTKTDFQ